MIGGFGEDVDAAGVAVGRFGCGDGAAVVNNEWAGIKDFSGGVHAPQGATASDRAGAYAA